jgi:pyridine nucleotide-disulfide oxidoreductase family protein
VTAHFDLILAGAGHAHLGVLRLWAQGRRPAGRIGLVGPVAHAWYSGMLPGLLAGRYRAEHCRIALGPLCAAAGVELLQGQIDGLDADSGTLQLSDGRAYSADWLSLNVGSQPAGLAVQEPGMELLPVKPFEAFVDTWQRWQRAPQALALLGGGAAGVELALAMAPRVPALTLFSRSPILSGHPAALRRRALRHLASAGVTVGEGVDVGCARADALVGGDEVIWRGQRAVVATGASALPWLRGGGLACDAGGFVRIAATLQSLSHPRVLAVGDCASHAAMPRNGVYAVRQGPVLAANLQAALSGQPLQPFRPQRNALALLADGRGGALLSWAGLTAEGRWLGRWKDHLDRRFIARHSIGP